MEIWIWTAVTIVALIVEFATNDLVSIWFSVGGVVAIITSAIFNNFYVDLVAFVAVSALCLAFLRKFVAAKLDNGTKKFNADSFVGKTVKLLTAITKSQVGTAKIASVVYNCKSQNGQPIEQDTDVEVVEISGNTLVVKAINEN